jgi:hypothetical protein
MKPQQRKKKKNLADNFRRKLPEGQTDSQLDVQMDKLLDGRMDKQYVNIDKQIFNPENITFRKRVY